MGEAKRRKKGGGGRAARDPSALVIHEGVGGGSLKRTGMSLATGENQKRKSRHSSGQKDAESWKTVTGGTEGRKKSHLRRSVVENIKKKRSAGPEEKGRKGRRALGGGEEGKELDVTAFISGAVKGRRRGTKQGSRERGSCKTRDFRQQLLSRGKAKKGESN